MSNHQHAKAGLPQPISTIGEILIGTLVNIDPDGHPLVTVPGSTEPLPALTTVSVTRRHLGRHAAVLFAQGNQPVIVGLIHSPLQELLIDHPGDAKVAEVSIDGKRVVLEGQEEIVLKCGDASITLTKTGKIVIRGKYLLSDATGVQRLVGGSVLVN